MTESIDTSSPTGRMFIKIIGLFAEFERETIVERIKVGLERKVKEGYSLCSSTTSFGYERKKGQKVQKIDENESKVVKEIFLMYLNDTSIREIVKSLNDRKIKTKKNCKWSYKTVKNILSNPNYIGKVRYGINTKKYFEVKGYHDHIISNDVFFKVQQKLNTNLRTKMDAYYSNKLECLCQNKMYTKRAYINNKCYINYVCKNAQCPIKSISHNFIDKVLNLKNQSLISKKDYVQSTIEKIKIMSIDKKLFIQYFNG